MEDTVLLEKLKHIQLLLLDVDGVLTDGTFERHGSEEVKRFHVAENGDGQSSNVVGIDWGGEPVEIIFADGFESGSTSSWPFPE